MAARKKDDADEVVDGNGYHGQAAGDLGYDHRPEDVATFAEHCELDAGVTVNGGGVEAVSVKSEK